MVSVVYTLVEFVAGIAYQLPKPYSLQWTVATRKKKKNIKSARTIQ